MKRFITFINIFFITLGALSYSSPAIAGIIRIHEPRIELELAPGEVYTGETVVENPTEEAVDLKIYLEDWVYKGNGTGEKDFSPAKTTPRSASGWIAFSPAQSSVGAYGKQSVRYTIQVPQDATGGYYSVLFFESTIGEMPDVNQAGANIRVAGRIGALFFIQVKGTIRRAGEVVSVDVVPPDGNKPMEIKTTFKNTGNVDITLGGNFLVMSGDGQILGRGNLDKIYTFPDMQDARSTQWVGRLPQGVHDLLLTYDLGQGQAIVKEDKITVR